MKDCERPRGPFPGNRNVLISGKAGSSSQLSLIVDINYLMHIKLIFTEMKSIHISYINNRTQ